MYTGNIFTAIDNLLNTITMYRLVLYYLLFLWLVAVILSWLGLLPYSPVVLVVSALFFTIVCWSTNKIFARVFAVPINVESVYITAFILVLIINPPDVFDSNFFVLAGWASVLAMATKYVLAVRKKHVFNPAAVAVAVAALTLNQSATWWIGTAAMAPFVMLGGWLIVRKIRHTDLVVSFFMVAMLTILSFSFTKGTDLLITIKGMLLDSPLLFFAFVMMTEPLTTPPTSVWRLWYGALTGFLFSPYVHISSIYSTPELALLAGNLFSYVVSPKERYLLTLKEKIKITPDLYDFLFQTSKIMRFKPGQYLEWTLAHEQPDSRGNRRYFTIASAPTEKDIRVGIKFYPAASSFKKHLQLLNVGDSVMAGQLAGDFLLPKDKKQKLIFIAGGIGITPFRSMIKFLIDRGEKREVVLFYSNRTAEEVVYRDVFLAAEGMGIKTVYTLTDVEKISANWKGEKGYITQQMIQHHVPDYRTRLYYISGPHAMVKSFESTLRAMGLPREQIKVDFFPGFV